MYLIYIYFAAAEQEELQRQKEQEEEWARQEALRIKKQEEEEAAKLAALQQATPESDQNRYDLPPDVSFITISALLLSNISLTYALLIKATPFICRMCEMNFRCQSGISRTLFSFPMSF